MKHTKWKFPFIYRNKFAHHPEDQVKLGFWRFWPSMIKAYAHLLFARNTTHGNDLAEWIAQDALSETFTMPSIMWIGHATFLIRIGNKTILTDPIFDTLSHILTFKRYTKPGIALENLPKIDAILISHNHPDHMDMHSLTYLQQRDNPLFLVPHGDKAWLSKQGITRVKEHMWWDTVSMGDVSCTFVPAVHWSQRGLFDYNTSLWGGWVIESHSELNGRIFFAGDTAYGSHFKAIADHFTGINIALLPIGPSEPRELMKCSHLSAEEAGTAFKDLGAQTMIPMHWGAYRLGTEHMLEPLHRVQRWWENNKHLLSDKTLLCMKMGQQQALHTLCQTPSAIIQPHIHVAGK